MQALVAWTLYQNWKTCRTRSQTTTMRKTTKKALHDCLSLQRHHHRGVETRVIVMVGKTHACVSEHAP